MLTRVGPLSLMDLSDVFVQRSLLAEIFLAVRTHLGLNDSVKSLMASKGLLLQRDPADWTGGHLGSNSKVVEQMIN